MIFFAGVPVQNMSGIRIGRKSLMEFIFRAIISTIKPQKNFQLKVQIFASEGLLMHYCFSGDFIHRILCQKILRRGLILDMKSEIIQSIFILKEILKKLLNKNNNLKSLQFTKNSQKKSETSHYCFTTKYSKI